MMLSIEEALAKSLKLVATATAEIDTTAKDTYSVVPLCAVIVYHFPSQQFTYISPSVEPLLGLSSTRLMTEGLPLLLGCCAEQMPEYYQLLEQYIFQSFYQFSPIERKQHTLKAILNMKVGQETKWMSLDVTPIDVDENGFWCHSSLTFYKLDSEHQLFPSISVYLRNDKGEKQLQSFYVTSEVPFTRREMEVIQRLSIGQRIKEIALALNISPFTVNTHLKNIRNKAKGSTLAKSILAASHVS
jgi:DNA-binding CsgD family transcriptional regulator